MPTTKEKREFLRAIQKWADAELAKGPHIGCEICRVEDREIPLCPCPCHVDDYLDEPEED